MKKTILIFYFIIVPFLFFAQNPIFQWANKIGSGGYDFTYSLATDTTDNVYITGSFSGVVDFDPGVGTFTLSSPTADNAYIAKYNGTGNILWAQKLEGKINSVGSAITYDKLGFIYVAGTFADTVDFDPSLGTYTLASSGLADVFISKYDLLGNFIWAKKIGGSQSEGCQSISTSNAGDIYLTGNFSSTTDFDPSPAIFSLTTAGSDDIYILKLNSAGTFVWAKRIGSTSQDIGYSVTVDNLGSVHLVGFFMGTVDFDPNAGVYNMMTPGSSVQNTFVLKLNALGNFVFAKCFQGSYPGKGMAVAVDINRSIYITGGYSGITDFDPGSSTFNLTASNTLYSCYIVKLDSSGSLNFAKSIDNPGSSSSMGTSIAVDSKKNIFTYGGYTYIYNDFDPGPGSYSLPNYGINDNFILKLDSIGDFAWVKNFGGSSYDYSTKMSVNKFGSIYTAGYFTSTVDFNPDAPIYSLTAVSYDGFVHKMLESPTVDISEILNEKTTIIHPNPTSGLLTITSKTELQKIEVVSLTGQVLVSEITTNVSHTVHLENLSNGLYFVNVYQNDRIVKREKIVLNK
ncbi:MAG: T9SS type A sorting domain-containing protein [Burkholderiales bacterium]|nr:T9SS type A sorting domain-containing protein [Bacteroidia bacterium]